jgi:hypothetical protein
MAVPENEFCSYKLSLIKKTNIWHISWVMQTLLCDAAIAKSRDL